MCWARGLWSGVDTFWEALKMVFLGVQEATVRLRMCALSLMLKKALSWWMIFFFSFVTGGVWDQKTSQLMAQNLSAWLVGAGDSSVSLSALPPAPTQWACRRHLITMFWKMGTCFVTTFLYESGASHLTPQVISPPGCIMSLKTTRPDDSFYLGIFQGRY